MGRYYREKGPSRAEIHIGPFKTRVDTFTPSERDSLPKLRALQQCLELGLPRMEARLGMASQEAAHVREILNAIERS